MDGASPTGVEPRPHTPCEQLQGSHDISAAVRSCPLAIYATSQYPPSVSWNCCADRCDTPCTMHGHLLALIKGKVAIILSLTERERRRNDIHIDGRPASIIMPY